MGSRRGNKRAPVTRGGTLRQVIPPLFMQEAKVTKDKKKAVKTRIQKNSMISHIEYFIQIIKSAPMLT